MSLNYAKVLRNLKFEHEEIKQKRSHKKCKTEPCQIAFLITYLEAHPPNPPKELNITKMKAEV